MSRYYSYIYKIFRKIYSKLGNIPNPRDPLPNAITNPDDVNHHLYNLIRDDNPCMIARFGSTELSCLLNYIDIQHGQYSISKYIKGDGGDWWWNPHIMEQMKQWSGFFPATEEKLSQFSELMLQDIKQLDVLGSWVSSERRLSAEFDNVYVTLLRLLEPFWCDSPWTKALEGKKVVVVHPFAELIEYQYKNNREKLFRNPNVLPVFELRTVQAVQSLGGESCAFSDWFEALEWMKLEIDKSDYEVALIGCGAYGFPLAAHVKRQGKKAVHLGGALQLLFGIKGKRWENPNYGVKEWGIPYGFYSNLMNEFWIRPGDDMKPKNAQQVEGACYW